MEEIVRAAFEKQVFELGDHVRSHLTIVGSFPNSSQLTQLERTYLQILLSHLSPWEFIHWIHARPECFPRLDYVLEYLQMLEEFVVPERPLRQRNEYELVRTEVVRLLRNFVKDIPFPEVLQLPNITSEIQKEFRKRTPFVSPLVRKIAEKVRLYPISAHASKDVKDIIVDAMFGRNLPWDVLFWIVSKGELARQVRLANDYIRFRERNKGQENALVQTLSEDVRKWYEAQRIRALDLFEMILTGKGHRALSLIEEWKQEGSVKPPSHKRKLAVERDIPPPEEIVFPIGSSESQIEVGRQIMIGNIQHRCWMDAVLMNVLLDWLRIRLVIIDPQRKRLWCVPDSVHIAKDPPLPFGWIRYSSGVHYEVYYYQKPGSSERRFSVDHVFVVPETIQKFMEECKTFSDQPELKLITHLFSDMMPAGTTWGIQRTIGGGNCFYHSLYYVLMDMYNSGIRIPLFEDLAFLQVLIQTNPLNPKEVMDWLRNQLATLTTKDIYLRLLKNWDPDRYLQLGLPM